MENTRRSSLHGKIGRLAGFAFYGHPVKAGWSLNMVVYRTSDHWVICLSECQNPEPDKLRPCLGMDVPGDDFSKYAVRGIESKLKFLELQELLTRTIPANQWEWATEAQLQGISNA